MAAAFPRTKPEPTAGYFTLRSAENGRILFLCEIDDNPPEKVEGRCFNSQEKGKRIFDRREFSSWQSRDVDHATQKKYGGAIRTPDFILSFSGLPELADETLCCIVAVRMGWISKSAARELLGYSNNLVGQGFFKEVDADPSES